MTGRVPMLHLLLALAVVAVWGTNFVVIHVALTQFQPLMLATLRFSLAALPWIFVLRRPNVSWQNLAAYGVLIGVGQFGLLYFAMQRDISPGLASLVMQTQAFFTIGLAALLHGERVKPYQYLALATSAAGLILIAINGRQSVTPLGLIVTLTASLCWACSNLVVRRAGRVDALAYVVWSSVFAIMPLCALTLLTEGGGAFVHAMQTASASVWMAVLWQSLANTIFGYGVWSWLLARHQAATITPTSMLVPVFGLTASAAILGEAMPVWKLFAAALVVGGLAVNLLWSRVRQPVRAG